MSEAFTIKRGSYKLAYAVENPKPRKRSRSWHDQPLWEAGTRFVIEDYPIGRDEVIAHLRLQGGHAGVAANHEAFWPILRALVPLQEQPSDMLDRIGLTHWTSELLDALCARGCFTLADAEATVKALVEADVAEYEARQQAKKDEGE